MKHIAFRLTPLALAILAVQASHAQTAQQEKLADQIQQQQFQREQQREQQFQQSQQHNQHIILDNQASSASSSLPSNESPCFPVHQVVLVGESTDTFQFALDKALKQSSFQSGMCLGAVGINHLMTLAQNAVIDKGYTTTRILAAPQDMKSGTLELTVLPGKVSRIRVDESNQEDTHADRIAAFQNEFPVSEGGILNLREIEQGLENVKRLPTVEADIQIRPSENGKPDESEIVLYWKQRTVPYRLTLGFDDSGSKSTGKYQGNITFSADNPLGLSDMFYVSYGRHLGGTDDKQNETGREVESGSNNVALHYSVPFGNWLFAYNHSSYRYHQAVGGLSEVYDYSGRSHNNDLSLSRLLYRDAKRKTHLTGKLWKRETRSYIDDAELDVQRRKTGGWALNLSHKEYLGNATLGLNLGYKRGTRLDGALHAPEEAFNEGSGKMKIITADADLNLPFTVGKQHFRYDTRIHSQWNKTPLTPQDKLAIGGRYTVRGFDGEMSLSAERGWYWRNELAWQYRPQHQLYAAADIGRVSGDSTKYLLGQTLAGAAVGLRGAFNAGGSLSYDVFAGKALKKPEYFRTKRVAAGVNVSYSF
ncbi:MAG: ShlB/FhaC/HecB family hemolysin secretion/activation protein [Neisseria sp.]|nr:ShlB/FhaC/HecB family hemolysin secretion/activation protein [Neisseria sp.]